MLITHDLTLFKIHLTFRFDSILTDFHFNISTFGFIKIFGVELTKPKIRWPIDSVFDLKFAH